jgi:flagellin FlaB
MGKKYMERLVGKYCKIVTKEPGEDRANVVTGILEDIDYKDGFILVDSSQGLGCLRINTIVAIKPGKQRAKHKNIKNDEQGFVGIGTLIVFIAMILVAAIAASVIIQTSEQLQQRAQAVGSQTIREVSSGLMIEDIVGYTNEAKTKIEYMVIAIRPRAGSKDIDLSMLTLSMANSNLSVLTLNTSRVINVNLDNQSVFHLPLSAGSNDKIYANLTQGEFALIATHDYDGSITSTLGMNLGDRAYLMVNLTAIIPDEGGLGVRKSISGKIHPEIGSSGVYEISAPAVFTTRVIDLW